jgi:hypothetical protein
LRLLVFLFCATLLVLGQFGRTFEDSERYGYLTDIMPSDWAATNVWLASSACALERGVWLAVCEKGKLVPISERAVADDPGHALLLDLWSMATRSRATLPDVARLNTLLDALGLLALAGLLFSLRAWLTSIVLMWLGPVEYVGWMGTSPHWSYIGLVSMSAVLPIALAAKDLGLLARRVGNLWIAAGLLFLALATLARESIGIMGLLVSFSVMAVLVARRPHRRQRIQPLLLAGVLALAAFTTPKRAMRRSTCSPRSGWRRTACRTRSISAWASSRTSGGSATMTITARKSPTRPILPSSSVRPTISG